MACTLKMLISHAERKYCFWTTIKQIKIIQINKEPFMPEQKYLLILASLKSALRRYY
jgi:hypothetical protein